MQISRKKIIIISLAFLILFVMKNWQMLRILISMSWKPDERMSIWDFLTARPVPSSLTQYPTPGAPLLIPSNSPLAFTPYPTPRFGATWGQRLRPNGADADFDYMQWKTLRNDEYGFEVKYPSDWTYKMDKEKNQPGALPFAYTIFIFSNEKSFGQLRLMVQKKSQEEYEKSLAIYSDPVVKENILINGTNWTIVNSNAIPWELGGGLGVPTGANILRQGYLFEFGDIDTTKDVDTISHIVKSFRFIK